MVSPAAMIFFGIFIDVERRKKNVKGSKYFFK